jgi:hypothetical protein
MNVVQVTNVTATSTREWDSVLNVVIGVCDEKREEVPHTTKTTTPPPMRRMGER